MTFTPTERENAAAASQIIHNHGVFNNAAAIGHGSTATVTVNDVAAFTSLIERTGLNPSQRQEVIELFRQYHAATGAEKKTIGEKAVAFLGANAPLLAGMVGELMKPFLFP